MQPGNSLDANNLEGRLVRLETALMQLEHDVEQLNESLVAQHRSLEALRVVVERLEWRLDRESPSPPETRDPEAERPPHY
jgi:SlyX protein